jgi:hypothetical protein
MLRSSQQVTHVRGTKIVSALNAPTKALKNARIRRPFKGNKQWLAADVRGYKAAFPGPLWHSNPKRPRIAGEEMRVSGHVAQT